MAAKSDLKKVKLLCDPALSFSMGDVLVRADELTTEQAELVAAQYPGVYVEIVDNKAKGADDATK